MNLNEFKSQFDNILEEKLDECLKDCEKYVSGENLEELISHIKTLIMNGGKRFRPYLIDLVYRSFGGKNNIENVCLGMELFHNFALLHDDIFDKGETRHGVMTHHLKSKKMLNIQLNYDVDKAMSLSILAGDLLSIWAQREFFCSNIPSESFDFIQEMMQSVIVGEMMDVYLVGEQKPSLEQIEQKNNLKTSGYSFVYPMLVAASLAGCSNDELLKLEEIGKSLGQAYQIYDDYKDFYETRKYDNKSGTLDLEQGVHTFFTTYLLGHSDEILKKDFFENYFGVELDEKKLEHVKYILEESGSIKAGLNQIDLNLKKVVSIVEGTNLPTEFVEGIYGIISLFNIERD